MKLILLSGGSGRRLWPLSNDSRSKQFLKVLRNPNGELESMVQRVWRQLRQVQLDQSSFIVVGKSQEDLIRSQFAPNIPLIFEPSRRDTFPAIALAAIYLHSIEKVDKDEVICVLPVDPYVEDNFFSKVKELKTVLEQSNANLALIGVKPTYPSEKYGYIVPQHHTEDTPLRVYRRVNHFTEKPSEEQAKKLISHNALWNCGVFAFKLGYLLSLISNKGFSLEYEGLVKEFNRLPKNSFDYEVLEKESNIVVLPYEGSWKDLGTWITLTEEIDTPLIGNGIMNQNSVNTHLINELNIPVIVLDIMNSVVITTPDGILVADKLASHRLKEFNHSMLQRPMYEQKRWGSYRVLDYEERKEGSKVLVKRLEILAAKNLSYQMHQKRSEVWTIISGEGDFILNDRLIKVKKGDVLSIPIGAKHGIKAITDLQVIEVQMGSELVEEDITRICMTWEEAMKLIIADSDDDRV